MHNCTIPNAIKNNFNPIDSIGRTISKVYFVNLIIIYRFKTSQVIKFISFTYIIADNKM